MSKENCNIVCTITISFFLILTITKARRLRNRRKKCEANRLAVLKYQYDFNLIPNNSTNWLLGPKKRKEKRTKSREVRKSTGIDLSK